MYNSTVFKCRAVIPSELYNAMKMYLNMTQHKVIYKNYVITNTKTMYSYWLLRVSYDQYFASAVNDGTYRLIKSNRPLFASVRNKQVNRLPDG